MKELDNLGEESKSKVNDLYDIYCKKCNKSAPPKKYTDTVCSNCGYDNSESAFNLPMQTIIVEVNRYIDQLIRHNNGIEISVTQEAANHQAYRDYINDLRQRFGYKPMRKANTEVRER